MSSLPESHVTVEEYFALDEASPVKLEYYQGQVYAMGGALEPHNIIGGNAFFQLKLQLRGGGCRVYQSDQRITTGDGMFTCPDVSVACNPRFFEPSRRTLLNPVLIVEVLSASTEFHDRTGKFESYQTIESLKDYLLISSDRMHCDLYTRQSDGKWVLTTARHSEDVLDLPSCSCRLKLADAYAYVVLPAIPPSLRIVAEVAE
jgi:Uma2 family endonuclease